LVGKFTPSILTIKKQLTLSLFMFGIFTNNPHPSPSADYFALIAYFFD